MMDTAKFTGVAAGGGINFYDMGFYRKLGEGSNMSVDSIQTSVSGGSVAMSVENSSVGSSGSQTGILHHSGGVRKNTTVAGSSVGHSIFRPGRVTHPLNHDALAQALIDPGFPAQGLENYDEWTLDLRKLSLGQPFAQGAFGKLYRGTYNGEDVAIKLLERPENDLERGQLMEQQFAQEVMMLATLKHVNIVRFIGACRKKMVWCIVTEYAKGGSVRQFLMRRQNRSVPLKIAVRQALDVARGMAYVHGLGFIHRDLKSDNLLICGDKFIKIADFGVARIEVQTEGMTPETGTYRWMAPSDQGFNKWNIIGFRDFMDALLMNHYVEDCHVHACAKILTLCREHDEEAYCPFLYISHNLMVHFTLSKETESKVVAAYVKNVTKEKLDNIQIILMPECYSQQWFLLVSIVKEKKWLVHDSVHNPKRKDTAKKAVVVLQKVTVKKVHAGFSKWSIIYTSGIPQQENSVHCGVFVMKYMEHIAKAGVLSWTSCAD